MLNSRVSAFVRLRKPWAEIVIGADAKLQR